jgi:hypothetical protein
MKTVIIFIISLLFPICILSQSGPKLEVIGGENIDAGSHTRGKEVHYEIKFKNVGDADLHIMSVSTSCGCSTALATSDTIAPGTEGSINFTFNGSGFGPVAKNVFINTNESPNNIHTLLIGMNMIDPLTLDPASIMTQGKVGDEIKETATLQNSLDKDVVISDVSSNSPVVKVSADKMTINSGDKASFDISIKIFEDSPVNAAVIIKTSEGEYQIPILVDIKSN